MTRSHPHHHQGHNHSHSNNQREEADEKVPVTPRKVVVYTDNLMTSMGARNAITGNTSSDLIHSLADTLNTALVISTSFRFDPELNMLEILDPYNTRNHVVVKGLVNYTVSAKLFFLSAGMDASNQPSVVYIKQALTSVYNQLGEVPIDELYVSFADAETTHDLAATTASSSYSSESENNGDGNSQCTRDTSSISRYVNVWKALNQYKAEGDICKLGICDMTPQQIDQLMEVSEEAGPDMVQVQVGNDPDIASSLDPDMVMYAEKRGISINCHRDNPTLLTDRTFQVLASDFKINERFPTTEVPRKGYRIDFMRPRWVVNYSVTLRDRGIVVNRGYIVMASSDNNLPLLIVDCIIQYVLGRDVVRNEEGRRFFGGYYSKAYLEKLSLTCRSWRFAAIAYLCEEYYITYPYERIKYTRMGLENWKEGSKPSFAFEPLVKTLRVKFGTTWLATEKIPQNLRHVFENARRVIYHVCIDKLDRVEAPDSSAVDANVDAFIKHARQMAPNSQDVYIRTDGYMSNHQIIIPGAVKLLQRLSYIAKTSLGFTAYYNSNWIDLGDLAGLPRLTRMTFSNAIEFQYMGAIRKCSSTLQFLSLDLAKSRSYSEVILDDAIDGYVVYPNMSVLSIKGALSPSECSNEMPHPNAIPFPNLKKLSLKQIITYKDDVLFRGNSAALKFLDVDMDDNLCEVLIQNNTFYPNSHPNLCLVHARMLGNPTKHGISQSEYYQLHENIANNAVAYHLNGIRSFEGLTFGRLATDICRLQSIRHLNLTRYDLPFENMFELIKSLPMMERLECGYQGNFAKPKHRTHAKYFRQIMDKYYPLNSRLGQILIRRLDRGELEINDVRWLILLIILCPNVYNFGELTSRVLFWSETFVKRIVAVDGYKDYIPRLKQLSFFNYKI